ncbi:DNA topoisomerase IB [Phycicoccus sp. BSK3Z-2]|uniref:DNA topoisomerase n=1 Tax=Phycicoccus avicenniae TaxID=2828860 RepID=A0A941DBH3_9MICO|nr:DNA topoisomerase IB [Phycicoccus avicenniae]MBR7743458.1 DNA topoisomerase IB [Phycicoccus avicenniae]MBR7743942.1 DNA topoisomerase IB [Phycicoccus avicenniae]
MARLRRVSPRSAGWTRRRAGRHFSYRDAGGERLPAEDVARVKALAIPPAWEDVWICPYPTGHIQAVGTDAAGRRQYLYHPEWRAKRDELKFDRVVLAGARLARARERIVTDLAGEGMPLARAAATATRLLDLGYFRIGSDAYADSNGSFGLTTLERRHVRRRGEDLVFSFVGKSGVEHSITISDPAVIESLNYMRRRRGGSKRLLAYRGTARWADLDAAAVNDYISQMVAEDLTAKDFRTWHATVLAAVALAESDEPGDTKASRKQAEKAAVEEVAAYLGNTPTIARSSYIDPRVLDRYEDGVTIAGTLRRRYPDETRRQAAVEKAVARLVDGA